MSNERERIKDEKWELLPPSSAFEKHFKTHRHHTKYIKEFEENVTTDPFHHPARNRICPLTQTSKRYPKGSHRWRKSDLRIVYYPNKDDRTVYPLDANTAGNIGYKKRG